MVTPVRGRSKDERQNRQQCKREREPSSPPFTTLEQEPGPEESAGSGKPAPHRGHKHCRVQPGPLDCRYERDGE